MGDNGFRNLVLGVLLAIMVGWLLAVGRPIILPIVASLITVYIVLGLADLIGRTPVVGRALPSGLRHGLAVLAILGALAGLTLALAANVSQIIASWPVYQERLLTLVQKVAVTIGVETEPSWTTLRAELLGRINLQRTLIASAASVSGILGTFFVVIVYTGFLLAERGVFAGKIARLSSDPARVTRIRQVIEDVNARIGAYLVTKTLINLLLGALSYGVLRLLGIEFAGFWAILIGLFNYIPYLGSFLGVIPPALMAALQFGEVWPGVMAGLALSVPQVAIGNFIDPWLMGRSVNLSPFVILASLVVWSTIWGVSGAILSVPITAILVIVLSEFQGTRPIAVLLSLDGEVQGAGREVPARTQA